MKRILKSSLCGILRNRQTASGPAQKERGGVPPSRFGFRRNLTSTKGSRKGGEKDKVSVQFRTEKESLALIWAPLPAPILQQRTSFRFFLERRPGFLASHSAYGDLGRTPHRNGEARLVLRHVLDYRYQNVTSKVELKTGGKSRLWDANFDELEHGPALACGREALFHFTAQARYGDNRVQHVHGPEALRAPIHGPWYIRAALKPE